MGKGRIVVSGALVRDLFSFPKETVLYGGPQYDSIEIVVEHPDIPSIPEGSELPRLDPSFRRQPSVAFDGWNPLRLGE